MYYWSTFWEYIQWFLSACCFTTTCHCMCTLSVILSFGLSACPSYSWTVSYSVKISSNIFHTLCPHHFISITMKQLWQWWQNTGWVGKLCYVIVWQCQHMLCHWYFNYFVCHFHVLHIFILLLFYFCWNLAVFVTCYWNNKLTYLLTVVYQC